MYDQTSIVIARCERAYTTDFHVFMSQDDMSLLMSAVQLLGLWLLDFTHLLETQLPGG